jgi:hypothetical protein
MVSFLPCPLAHTNICHQAKLEALILVDRLHRFGETFYVLHLQGVAQIRGVTSHKTAILTFQRILQINEKTKLFTIKHN